MKTAEEFYTHAIIERTQACFDQNKEVNQRDFIIKAIEAYATDCIEASLKKTAESALHLKLGIPMWQELYKHITSKENHVLL